jgi:hypothetical protein
MGRRVCGWCRDLRLHHMQTPRTVDPARVVTWARIFDFCMALGGAAYSVLGGGYFTLLLWEDGGRPGRSAAPTGAVWGVMLTVIALLALVSLAVYLPPAIALKPGRGYLWNWQLVVMILGIVTSLGLGQCMFLTAIPAVVLLIYWLKPEVRAYCEGQRI